MRRLLLSGVVLAGVFFVARQYGSEMSLLFGTSTGAVSRAEKPNAGVGRILEIFNGCGSRWKVKEGAESLATSGT